MSARGIGAFWTLPKAQLYRESERLAELGLMVETRESIGRRRRVFSVTDDGHRELASWLSAPTVETPEIRDVGILKLFFNELAGPNVRDRLADAQRRMHQERLDACMENSGTDDDDEDNRIAIAFEKAAIGFWSEVAQIRNSRPS